MSYKDAVEIMAWWNEPRNQFDGRYKVRETILAERVIAAKKNAKLVENQENGEHGLLIDIEDDEQDQD